MHIKNVPGATAAIAASASEEWGRIKSRISESLNIRNRRTVSHRDCLQQFLMQHKLSKKGPYIECKGLKCVGAYFPLSWLYIVLTGLSIILFLENYSMMTVTIYNYCSRQCQEMAWTHNLIAFQVKDSSVYNNPFFALRTMTHSKTGCRIWYCF